MPWNVEQVKGKWCVMKDGEDKPVGCHEAKADALAQLAALYANEKNMSSATGQLDVEIFAVGKWNGMEFTADDLQNIAAAFNTLQDNHRVPLKFGHNNEQPVTDGQPALGWVKKVWVDGAKLFATFADVPAIVMEAIKKKLYRNVSIELDLDVMYKSQHYPAVLSGVALLGADIPAVNTLKDLTHYMGRGAGFSAGRRAVFSAVAGNQPKENVMDLEKLTAKVAELSSTVATFTADNAKLKAENAELAAKVAKFEADNKASEAAATKGRLEAKRTEVLAILEDGVKGAAITPAQRETFKKALRVDDDAAVQAIDVESVKAMVGPAKKQFSREQAAAGAAAGAGEKTTLRADQELVVRCKELVGKGEAKTIAEARGLVFARDPELADRYVNMKEV